MDTNSQTDLFKTKSDAYAQTIAPEQEPVFHSVDIFNTANDDFPKQPKNSIADMIEKKSNVISMMSKPGPKDETMTEQ